VIGSTVSPLAGVGAAMGTQAVSTSVMPISNQCQEDLKIWACLIPCFCTNRRHFNFFVQTEPVLTRENKGKSAIAGNGEYDWKTSFDLAAQGDFP